MTVLVLCHGNICRSPAATALMHQAGYTDVICAGFKPGGARSPKKVRDYAQENWGIDLTTHRAVEVTPQHLRDAELVLYMDGGQRARLEAMWKAAGLDVERGALPEFAEPLGRYLDPPSERIGDPMFQQGGSPEFIAIMQQLEQAAKRFVDQRIEKKEAAA